MSAESWLRMTVTLPAGHQLAGDVQTMLAEAAGGVQVEDAHTLPDQERALPQGQQRLIAYFSTDRGAEVETLRSSLREHLQSARETEICVEIYSDTSWRDGWKAWFQPMQVSRRLAVRAPWAKLEVSDEVHTLVIEPGMAFGTGTHETTRLCMSALDHVIGDEPPAAMLDVGCGSGVLAIAAAMLGVPHTVGIDVDDAAVEASIENAAINGVSGEFSTTRVQNVAQQFPLVVANIISSILISLRDGIVARVAPGGTLLLSGLLREEAREVAEGFLAEAGWSIQRIEELGEWAAVVIAAGGEPS